jgi:hypothetical protein
VALRGKAGGHATTRQVALDLPAAEAGHDALASLWARGQVGDLMSQDMTPQVQDSIATIGVEFGIATQFTSFIAVEEQTITTGGKARKVAVPVNMPEGMSYQGIQGGGSGVVGGVPGGVIGGIIGGVPSAAPPPPHPPAPAPRAFTPHPAIVGVLPSTPSKLDAALSAMMKPENAKVQVEVQVLLRDASAATLSQLTDAGLVVLKPAGASLIITGQIAVLRLADLTRVGAVRYVVKVTAARR